MIDAPAPKKDLGQNYLVDQNIIRKIIASINPHPGETLIEIGSGPGTLTEPLLRARAKVIVVEKDPRFTLDLERIADDVAPGNLTIHEADALKFRFDKAHPSPCRLVGNLPYNVGTQILMKALKTPERFPSMTFMLQKEVIDRILAEPGSKDWGRLAVWCDLLCDRVKLFDVPPTAFHPQPRVVSSVVRLTTRREPLCDYDRKKLDQLMRQAFGQRRKMLRSSLKGLLNNDDFIATDIDPKQRPEELSTKELCKLSLQIKP